jgi:hypothetical protein
MPGLLASLGADRMRVPFCGGHVCFFPHLTNSSNRGRNIYSYICNMQEYVTIQPQLPYPCSVITFDPVWPHLFPNTFHDSALQFPAVCASEWNLKGGLRRLIVNPPPPPHPLPPVGLFLAVCAKYETWGDDVDAWWLIRFMLSPHLLAPHLTPWHPFALIFSSSSGCVWLSNMEPEGMMMMHGDYSKTATLPSPVGS